MRHADPKAAISIYLLFTKNLESRSSNSKFDNVKSSIVEILNLLQRWDLMELQSTFTDNDVTLRSLIYLTDEEISELVPKIGTRTIFRAMLREWRKTYDAISYSRTPTSAQYGADSDSYLDQIELKTECSKNKFHVINCETGQNTFQLESLDQNQDKQKAVYKNYTKVHIMSETDHNQFNYECKPFIVLDILNSCADGQTVLEFYKLNNFLDSKNRKRIVSLLIRSVVERKVEKYTAIFHDMTRQLLQIFPTEKYETYFVAHNGPNSARGALYYRYSNYTRQLRKEGLLAYKKNIQISNNKKFSAK